MFITGGQVVIKYPGYTSYWNSQTLIPDSVTWVITPHQKVVDREVGFHTTGGRVNLGKDYAHSGYDIGHNCDASDENGNKIDEYNSFDYANTFPQLPKLNRFTWEHLENYCRAISIKFGACRVKTWWSGVDTRIGKDGVVVPLYCYKQIWYGKVTEIYKMPNRDTVIKHEYTYYRIK